MKHKISLALAASILCATWSSALAADEVRLILWVADREAFTDADFALGRARRDRDAPMTERVLRADARSTDIAIMTMPMLFAKDDRVREIIVSTHGTTVPDLNHTELRGLGGFDPSGAFGGLRDVLAGLAKERRLMDHLHIELDACSTLAGDPAAARARAEGLAKYVSSLGVSHVTCWGARHRLWSARYQSARPRMRYPLAAWDMAFSIEGLVLLAAGEHVYHYAVREASWMAVAIVIAAAEVVVHDLKLLVDVRRENGARIDEMRGYTVRLTPLGITFEDSGPRAAVTCANFLAPEAG